MEPVTEEIEEQETEVVETEVAQPEEVQTIEINKEKVIQLMCEVTEDYKLVEDLTNKLVTRHVVELDEVLNDIHDLLQQDSETIVNEQLHKYILLLPSILSNTGVKLEQLKQKSSLMGAKKSDAYNIAHLAASGTVHVKKSKAELASYQEKIVDDIYKSSYEQIKVRITAGYEQLNSLKKVLSDRSFNTNSSRGFM